MGVDTPHRPDHERGPLSPLGLGIAVVCELSSGAHLVGRGGRRGARSVLARPLVPSDQGPRHPRSDGVDPHPPEPHRPPSRDRKTVVCRGGDWDRRTIRRGRSDHRHRRRVRIAHRTSDPRDAFGTQDPPRVWCRRGHVGDVRHAARRGRARDRAAALRVLEPRVRAARRRVERRRRDARSTVRPRPAVSRAPA